MKYTLAFALCIACPIAAVGGNLPTVTRVSSEPYHCTTGATACYVGVSCPVGTVVWGGGILGDEIKVESSYPSTSGTSWVVGFRGAFREYASTAHAIGQAFALCAAPPPGYNIVLGSSTHCAQDGPSCQTELECGGSAAALSGGVFGDQSEIESSFLFGNSGWVISWYPDGEDFASTAHGNATPFVICVDTSPVGFTQTAPPASDCNHDGPSCTSVANCSEGTVLIGGGFLGLQSKVESIAPLGPAGLLGAWYPAGAEYGSTAIGQGDPVAICAAGTALVDELFSDGFDG